jgi:hypothetical protein
VFNRQPDIEDREGCGPSDGHGGVAGHLCGHNGRRTYIFAGMRRTDIFGCGWCTEDSGVMVAVQIFASDGRTPELTI